MVKKATRGNWARCKAPATVTPRGTDVAEHFWPDLVVNLDRELAPGFTIGQAFAGREDVFEPAEDPRLSAAVDEPAATPTTQE